MSPDDPTMLRVEFQVSLSGIISRLFETSNHIELIEIDNAFPVVGDKVFLFMTIRCNGTSHDPDIKEQLSDVNVVHTSVARPDQQTYYLGLITDLSDTPVLSLLTQHRTIPHMIVGNQAHLTVIASVRDWNHLKQLATDIESQHSTLELIGTTQTNAIGLPLDGSNIKRTLIGKLSEEQLEVLETAYKMGYFKVPQEATAAEIASELKISRSTLSERLRRVQHNLCGLLFGSKP